MPDFRYIVRQAFHDPDNGTFYQPGDTIDQNDHDRLQNELYLDRFCVRTVAPSSGPPPLS